MTDTAIKVDMIPTDRIDPSPDPVRAIKIATMEEIRDSIKADGLYQPIIVRPKGDRYEVVAGFHRYVALKTSGHKKIPCIVRQVMDDDALLISIAENVQRNTHLDPIREGQIFAEQVEKGRTVEEIAHKIGKKKNTTYVSERIHVYEKLHPKLQNRVSKGHLSFQNAKAIADRPLGEQFGLTQKIDAWKKERRERLPVGFDYDPSPCRRCAIHCPKA